MVKLVLLKKAKSGVSREELIEYLREIHGPRNSELPGIQNYSLSVQVDPETHDDVPEELAYYDSRDDIPVDPAETKYSTLEIHEFETINDLIKAHTSTDVKEAARDVEDVIDFEDEVAFVVEDKQIDQ